MKKIEAFIKAHRLDDVTLALHDVEGMTVTEARGRRRGRDVNQMHVACIALLTAAAS